MLRRLAPSKRARHRNRKVTHMRGRARVRRGAPVCAECAILALGAARGYRRGQVQGHLPPVQPFLKELAEKHRAERRA
eukprot:6200175-Pleurochrysis_carterae.AAC.2